MLDSIDLIPAEDAPAPFAAAEPSVVLTPMASDGWADLVAAAAKPFDEKLGNPQVISASRILAERPDVMSAYVVHSYEHRNGHHHDQWVKSVGGDTPESYARYWYGQYGRYEGYSQGETTAGQTIDIGRLLQDRPDVIGAYQRDYTLHHGWRSHAWRDRMPGSTLEDYAKYWYAHHGEGEGYNQRPPPASAAPDPAAPEPTTETGPSPVEPKTEPAPAPVIEPILAEPAPAPDPEPAPLASLPLADRLEAPIAAAPAESFPDPAAYDPPAAAAVDLVGQPAAVEALFG